MFLGWILANKVVLMLSILLTAFVIATIVLAVELDNSRKDETEVTTISPSTPRPDTGSWKNQTRIPVSIVPVSYDLLLHPDLVKGVFTGSVTVQINLQSPRDWLAIHSKDLTINSVTITSVENITIPIAESFTYEENELFIIKPVAWLEAGAYDISLSFSGSLLSKIVGFYKSTYTEGGLEKSIATSKFEPVDARQAFPCFDEPQLKAKFKVRLVRPAAGYIALSNMNVESETTGEGPNEITTHFAETVPMSTYLACFIVCDFKDSGEALANKIPIKVYSTPGQVTNTEFAKIAAVGVTKFYINYFDINYPLPKLDLIAIPDFVSGAMEHWGLITFRETALLFNKDVNSAANQKRVALVVAHEIAHQWFGNLVTMKWWDDLWLNEGFASFMEYKGAEEGIPECKDWQLQAQALYDDVQPVLLKDAELSSHPIVQPVNHPDQITEIFDTISYNKGLAVLRMLEDFVGKDEFKKGIQNYLKSFNYSNAATSDLWANLNQVTGPDINVPEIMDTWTRQMGFPVINVKRIENSWTLSQERFLADPDASYNSSESEFGYKWDVPIRYVTQGDATTKLIWLKRSDQSKVITTLPKVQYVKINHGQPGFYRVNYEKSTWMMFRDILLNNHKELNEIDRANLLDDACNLASAQKLDYPTALSMLEYLKSETEYLPWATGSTLLRKISDLLSYSGQFKKYVRSLVENLYGKEANQFSWDVNPNDSHIKRLLRVKILSLACYSGLPACIDDVGTKFKLWIEKPTEPIHADVRSLVFHYGMAATGKEEYWDIVWQRYQAESNVQEKVNLLNSLARVQEPWLLKRYLNYAKDESLIRSQDFFSVLGYIASNPVGSAIVWDFYRDQWLYLVSRFTLNHRSLGTSILSVTALFSDSIKLSEMESFFAANPNAGAGIAARKSALEKVKNNIKWLDRNEQTIEDWLATNLNA